MAVILSAAPPVTRLRLAASAKRELGPDGIADLCRNLFIGDCQICGTALGPGVPAASLHLFQSHGYAKLHHERCAKPRCSRAPFVIDDGAPAYLSYSTHQVFINHVLPGGAPARIPVMIVNPTLEAASLAQRADDTWRVSTVESYVRHGLTRAGTQPSMTVIDGASAQLRSPADGSHPALTVQTPGDQPWSGTTPHFMATAMHKLGGVAVVITTTINPTTYVSAGYSRDQFATLLGSGNCAIGWVPLSPGPSGLGDRGGRG